LSGRAFSGLGSGETFITSGRLNTMPSSNEYRNRAKEARKQANACRNEWERQGLLLVADQCERLAAYKDLTVFSTRVATATAQDAERSVGANEEASPNLRLITLTIEN
jgi:hypothetical protein